MIYAAYLFSSASIAIQESQPQLLLVVCFSAFAIVLAAHAFRVQALAAFAGLVGQQLLTFSYLALLLAALFFSWPWLKSPLSHDWASGGFFVLLSAHWLSLALFSPRPLPAHKAKSFLGQWVLYALISIALIIGLGFLGEYVCPNAPTKPGFCPLIRDISAGLAAGIMLVTALVLAYRNLRTRAALWFWLFLAALASAGTIIVCYQFPNAVKLALGVLTFASVLVVFGLLADRARFLNFESEVRRNLMDTVGHWENQVRRLAGILAHGSEAIVHVDLDDRITYASPVFAQLAGHDAQEMIGKPLKTVLPRPYYEAIVPAMQEARRERTARTDLHLQGGQEERVLQVASAPLLNERQKLQGVHLGLLEVTRYHRAERALSEALAEKTRSLNVFQQSLDNVAEALVITDSQFRVLHANDAFVRTTGQSRQDLVGHEVREYRGAEAYPWAEIKRRLAQNKPWRDEVIAHGQDGRQYASDLSVMPVEDPEGRFLHYLWIERDVTSRASVQQTQELERRVNQMSKLMKISEDIRLNMSLEVILQSVANAIHTLGWQRVAVFHGRSGDQFELIASAGFGENGVAVPRKFRKLTYADFAPYLAETFRLSSSFFIDSQQLPDKRPHFMPKELEVFKVGEWRTHDCVLVPIRARERYAGMIAVFCPSDGRRPTQQLVRDLEVFADDAAIAIENSRLMALHANNENQLRRLNQIGKTFRAAGTLEQVLCEIARILSEAIAQPALIAIKILRPSPAPPKQNGNPQSSPAWLAACGQLSSKGKSDGQLLPLSSVDETLLQRVFQNVVENEFQNIELAQEELWAMLKLPGGRNGNIRYRAKVTALRSRQENFGCILWLQPESDYEWDEEQLRFARELAGQAALTIDNARLFLQTEEKAHALEHVNKLISEFLASVSHELRTPLHAILQFSEIMLSEKPGMLNHEQKHQMEIVQRSGKNLLNLINDILDLSKIEAGKMEASWQQFNPADLLRETVAAMRPLGASKGLQVQLQIASTLPAKMVSDRHMLARVLTNLLGNAVKFTDKGAITIAAECQNRVLTLSVSDTGKGIPENRLQEIFEPFRQLESSEARKHGGTGLGLAISQRLMGILGGQLEVRSKEGKGSTFTIKLPIGELTNLDQKTRRPRGAARISETANAKATKRKGMFSKWFSSAKRRDAAILVVEDDESTRYAMEFILEDAGYRVSFAENGEAALLIAQRERPDIILMDIMMPNLDGYQVARMIKAQKQLNHIPLVALTARAMKGDREKALAAGYDDYLTKPFEKKDILAVIARWLEEGVERRA
ncbi:MAG: hybrid sensor histidine kinase/response regulator [bacterium]